tara:strand:+ start:165 stop:527 length:363 start_codon:yes stop_codon:yes gene_type:complete
MDLLKIKIMNGYEKQMYERDLPRIRIALESIAESLKGIKKETEVIKPIVKKRNLSKIYIIKRWGSEDAGTITFHEKKFTNFKLALREAKHEHSLGWHKVELIQKLNTHYRTARTYKNEKS